MRHSEACQNQNCPFFGKDPKIGEFLANIDNIPDTCPLKMEINASTEFANKIMGIHNFDWIIPSKAMMENLEKSLKFVNAMQSQAILIQQIVERNNAVLNAISSFSYLPKLLDTIPDYSKILGSYFEKFHLTLKIKEWEWLEEMLASEGRQDILQLLRDGTPDEFETEIISFCADENNLKKISTKMKPEPLYAPRMPIIEDSFWAHINKKYTLSVPSLLPQIEGIVWDLGTEIGFVEGRDIKSRQKKTTQKAGSIRHVVNELDDQELDSIIKEHIIYDIYPYMRIPILHGRNIVYGNDINSTKVILFLYALFYSIQKNRMLYEKNSKEVKVP